MKLVAIFDSLPKHDSALTGAWHYWNTPSGHVLFVCEPHSYSRAEKHIADLGGSLFPDLVGNEAVGDLADHKAFSEAGLSGADTAHRALIKLAGHFAWPVLDPRG